MQQIKPLSSKVKLFATCMFVGAGILGIIPWQLVASAENNSFATQCQDLEKCIKAVSELTGDKYIFDAEVKGKVSSSENVELNKGNATLLLTKALYMNGFTRAPLGEKNTYQILNIRNARDGLLPKLIGTTDNPPEFPNHWDIITFVYKVKYPEVVEEMARTARSFMPPNARIIPSELTGQIFFTDAAPNIKNVYEIIRGLDQKPTKALLEKWKHIYQERALENRIQHEMELRSKNEKETQTSSSVSASRK